jgi:hypothetical protein
MERRDERIAIQGPGQSNAKRFRRAGPSAFREKNVARVPRRKVSADKSPQVV